MSEAPPPDWAALYQQHRDAMYRVAARVLRGGGRADEAGDAVSAAMESLMKSPPANVLNWQAVLVTAVKRRALDLLGSSAVQNLCSQAFSGRDGRGHRPVRPQEARARYPQHRVRRARLPDVAQDRVDVTAAAIADRQATALGEDLLPRAGLQLPPQVRNSRESPPTALRPCPGVRGSNPRARRRTAWPPSTAPCCPRCPGR
jgi:DNA-directed RNA polymerase specialized sigma24 family protein